MKIIINILKLIPVKKLAKHLPAVIAFILNRVLLWTFEKYPHKAKKATETAEEIMAAIAQNIKAAKDGKVTTDEVEKGMKLWKEVFN